MVVVLLWLVSVAVGHGLVEKPLFGTPRAPAYGSLSAKIGSTIYEFGGRREDSWTLDELHAFNCSTRTWAIVPFLQPAPPARSSGAMLAVGELLYVFGGRAQSSQLLNDLWVYSPVPSIWRQLTTMGEIPRGRRFTDLFASDATPGLVWLFGGTAESGPLADLWSFNLATYTWKQCAGLENFPPKGYSCAVIPIAGTNRTIIITSNTSHTDVAGITVLYEVAVSDVGPCTWRQIPTTGVPPPGRYAFYAEVIGNNLYYAWGWNEYYSRDMDDLWTLDLTTYAWIDQQTLSTFGLRPRDSNDWHSHDGKLVIMGEWSDTYFTNQVVAFDPVAKTIEEWTPQHPLPAGRAHHCAAKIGDKMFVFGGLVNQLPVSDFSVFNVVTNTWTSIQQQSDTPSPRSQSACVAVDSRILVFGGLSAGGTLDDLHSYNVVTRRWSRITATGDAPTSRSLARFILLEAGDLVLMGGQGVAGVDSIDSDDAFILDLDDNIWTKLTSSGDVPTNYTGYAVAQHPSLPSSLVTSGGALLTTSSIRQVDISYANRTAVWTLVPVQLPARSLLSSVTVNSTIIIGPGWWYDWTVPDTYALTLDPPTLTKLPSLAMGLVGYSMVRHGTGYLVYGGFGTLHPGEIPVLSTLERANIWAVSIDDGVCADGSTLVGGVCASCAKGTYSSKGNPCKPCRAGFFGPYSGASSLSSCLPCPFGQYGSDPGAASCTPCPAGTLCTLGSTVWSIVASSADDTFESVQPPDNIVRQDDEVRKASIITASVFVTALVILICVFVMCAVAPCLRDRTGFKSFWQKLDFPFGEKHHLGAAEARRPRKTVLGGMFTFIFLLCATWMVAQNLLSPIMNNDILTRSLVPAMLFDDRSIYGSFVATVSLQGYAGPCVVPGSANMCDESVSVTQSDTGFRGLSSTPTCNQDVNVSVCAVTWTCASCTLSHVPGSVTFLWEDRATQATAVLWNVTTTAAMPERVSTTFGIGYAPSQRIFRGVAAPSLISVVTTPIVYRVASNSSNVTGYLVNTATWTPGSSQTYESYHDATGASVRLVFNVETSAVEVVVASQVTWISVISSTSGAIVSVLSVTAVMLSQLEKLLLWRGVRGSGVMAATPAWPDPPAKSAGAKSLSSDGSKSKSNSKSKSKSKSDEGKVKSSATDKTAPSVYKSGSYHSASDKDGDGYEKYEKSKTDNDKMNETDKSPPRGSRSGSRSGSGSGSPRKEEV